MRDMLLLALLAVGTLWALKQPWIGAMLWTSISLASPHVEFGHGLARMPVASGIAACTLIGLMLTKQRQNPFMGAPMFATLAFTIWICVTLPFSFYLDASLGLWERSMKIFLMLFVTVALIDDRRKLEVFIWTMVISIGYYGVKGGLFTIVTAGGVPHLGARWLHWRQQRNCSGAHHGHPIHALPANSSSVQVGEAVPNRVNGLVSGGRAGYVFTRRLAGRSGHGCLLLAQGQTKGPLGRGHCGHRHWRPWADAAAVVGPHGHHSDL